MVNGQMRIVVLILTLLLCVVLLILGVLLFDFYQPSSSVKATTDFNATMTSVLETNAVINTEIAGTIAVYTPVPNP